MKTIFISRELAETSPFHSLDKSLFKIHSESLIDFHLINIDKVPDANWYFFYSKNGVKYFYKSLGQEFMASRKNIVKIACMGYGTSNEFYHNFNYRPEFTGSGKPANVAKLFLAQIEKDDKIVFYTAQDSIHSVGRQLPDYINQSQIKIYKNIQKQNIDIPLSDFLIFTSPKNVEAYFNKYQLLPDQKIICIGRSTAIKAHSLGAYEIIIATNPSEKAIIKALKIITKIR